MRRESATACGPRSPHGGESSPAALIPHAKACGPVSELHPRQDRIGQGRLRGGDPARPARLRVRGLRREHLRRSRWPDPDPAAQRLDPGRDQPQVGDPDRTRPGLYRGRARRRPRRALHGRRGVPDRHRGRVGARPRDRRPRMASPARSPTCSRPSSRTPCTGALRSTRNGSTSWSNVRVESPLDAPISSRPSNELRTPRPPSGVARFAAPPRPPGLVPTPRTKGIS